jgi:transposase
MSHRGHNKAILAVARSILEISYHLMSRSTTYQELGNDYFDRHYTERVKRRSLAQLERLGYHVTLTPAAA